MLLLLLLLLSLPHQKQGAVINQCNKAGLFAMTFDDGPGQYLPQLLATLKSKNVRATFHLTTKYLTDPNIQSSVQQIASNGHLIGLRTESDWNLLAMSEAQVRSNVARQANVMASFIGYFPKFVRLPYQKYSENSLAAVESTGAIVTSHNLESYDYTNDGGRIVNAFQLSLSLLGPGEGSFISVQHDSIQASVAVTGKVIDIITGAGYKLVTLDECLGLGDMTKNKTPLKGGSGGGALTPMDPVAGGLPKNNPDAPARSDGNGGMGDQDPMMPGPSKKQNANSASILTTSFLVLIGLIVVTLMMF